MNVVDTNGHHFRMSSDATGPADEAGIKRFMEVEESGDYVSSKFSRTVEAGILHGFRVFQRPPVLPDGGTRLFRTSSSATRGLLNSRSALLHSCFIPFPVRITGLQASLQ